MQTNSKKCTQRVAVLHGSIACEPPSPAEGTRVAPTSVGRHDAPVVQAKPKDDSEASSAQNVGGIGAVYGALPDVLMWAPSTEANRQSMLLPFHKV